MQFPPSPPPPRSSEGALSWGSLHRLQLEVLTTQDYEGYSSSLRPPTVPGGSHSTPDSKEWGGGGALSGGLQDLRSDAHSEDPPNWTLFEGTKSWELSGGHQGPTQNRSHPRTDAGYLPGVQGRPLRKERHPSRTTEKTHCGFLNSSRSPPETSAGPMQFPGDIQMLNGLHQDHPGGADPLGWVRLALWVWVQARLTEINGSPMKKQNSFL